MKLATERRKGFTHVRGGRILATRTELEVPRDGIDQQGDYEIRSPGDLGVELADAAPYTPRPLESDGVTTRVGDLAIEVIDVEADRVIGHYFLSGPATGIIRYEAGLLGTLNNRTPTDATGYFKVVEACVVDLDPMHMPQVEEKLLRGQGEAMGHMASCMVVLTHTYRVAYFGQLHVPNFDTIARAASALHKVFTLSYAGAPPKGAHLIGTIHCPPAQAEQRIQGKQPVAHVHMQPAVDFGPYAAPPFAHELLLTAAECEDIEEVDFWTLDEGSDLVEPHSVESPS